MSDILRVTRMSPDNLGDWSLIDHELVTVKGGRERSRIVYEQAAGKPTTTHVGVWEAEPYEERMDGYPCDEFMVVLEGSCTIIEEDGAEHIFKQGDCFFIPRGMKGIWRQHENMKKYYVIVE